MTGTDTSTVRTQGLFGGTFDPVHLGHLILAEQAIVELGLDEVLFVPAARPPHKIDGRPISSGEDRAAMIELAIASNPRFRLSTSEIDRSGVSYTVDTLRMLDRDDPRPRVLLMGSDNARDFASWKEPDEIVERATIGVWERPGQYFWPEVMPDVLARKIPSPLIEISSTEIRRRVSEGVSIRYLTTDPVLEYISERGLYRI